PLSAQPPALLQAALLSPPPILPTKKNAPPAVVPSVHPQTVSPARKSNAPKNSSCWHRFPPAGSARTFPPCAPAPPLRLPSARKDPRRLLPSLCPQADPRSCPQARQC